MCIVSCGTDRGQAPAVTVTETPDSILVQNRRSAWALDPPAAWRIDSVASLVLGRVPGGVGVPLQRVGDVGVTAELDIIFDDQGSSTIFVFDAEGRMRTAFGGRGEGPGELQWVGALHLCRDTVFVHDGSLAVRAYSTDGAFQRRVPFRDPEGRYRAVVGVSADCHRFLVREEASRPAAGEQGAIIEVLYWTDLGSGGRDTLSTWSTGEYLHTRSREHGRSILTSVPWSGSGVVASSASSIVLGTGATASLEWHDGGGRVLRSRWDPEVAPVDAVRRRLYERARRDFFAGEGRRAPPDVFMELDAFDLPDYLPVFDRLVVDPAGYAWVRQVSKNSLGPLDDMRSRGSEGGAKRRHPWTVVDSTGRWLGTVTAPAGVRLMAVRSGNVYGIHTDTMGVHTVRVYRLLR